MVYTIHVNNGGISNFTVILEWMVLSKSHSKFLFSIYAALLPLFCLYYAGFLVGLVTINTRISRVNVY